MIAFIIRSKIKRCNIFVYFVIKNIAIFDEDNNFIAEEDNNFKHINNIQTIIKNKKYETIFQGIFLFFLFFVINIFLFS